MIWLTNNLNGHYKRAVDIQIGNIEEIIGSNVFLPSQAPRYPAGYEVALGLLLCCGFVYIGFFIGLRAENRRRDYREDHPLNDLNNIEDDHSRFRFILWTFSHTPFSSVWQSGPVLAPSVKDSGEGAKYAAKVIEPSSSLKLIVSRTTQIKRRKGGYSHSPCQFWKLLLHTDFPFPAEQGR